MSYKKASFYTDENGVEHRLSTHRSPRTFSMGGNLKKFWSNKRKENREIKELKIIEGEDQTSRNPEVIHEQDQISQIQVAQPKKGQLNQVKDVKVTYCSKKVKKHYIPKKQNKKKTT